MGEGETSIWKMLQASEEKLDVIGYAMLDYKIYNDVR